MHSEYRKVFKTAFLSGIDFLRGLYSYLHLNRKSTHLIKLGWVLFCVKSKY